MQVTTDNLSGFENVRILVVGDVMLDRYLTGSVERVSPEAPVPVLAVEKEVFVAGGAANVAANVAGLGAQCSLVSLIGEDSSGVVLEGLCSELGVERRGLSRSESRATTVKSRLMAGSHQIARFDLEQKHSLSNRELERLKADIAEGLNHCDAVIVSDYGKGLITRELAQFLIDSAGKKEIPVYVDPKGVDFRKYVGATIVTPNKKEAAEVFHKLGGEDFEIEKAGHLIRKEYEFEKILITLGADGIAIFSEDDSFSTLSAQARNVFDVTGAGDTVIATLAVVLASGESLQNAVYLANSAAGVVVERVGTTSIKYSALVETLLLNEAEGSNMNG